MADELELTRAFSADNASNLMVMLYMGASNVQVIDEAVVNSNRQMVQTMSMNIALANKEFFKLKLQDKLDEELQPMIKQINPRKGQRPIVDGYGRVTYYYTRLGDRNVPIYQPGTIMFECGVVSDSDLSVVAHGSQQNGAILGNGCAIFLCKFMARLVMTYQSLAEEADTDIDGPIDNDLYKTALTNTLRSHCREDATEHGRLLALKKILTGLTHEKALDEEQVACMYIKDLSKIQDRDVCAEETFEEILGNLPDELAISQIIASRSENQIMPDDEMFRQGSVAISEILPVIKEALLRKDGIVDSDKQDLFREQIESTLNSTVMKSLASKAIVRDTTQMTDAESTQVDEEDDDDDATSDAPTEDDEETKEEEDGDDGEAEENERTEALEQEEEGEATEEEVDQKVIDRAWIKQCDRNYPSWTYYKNLKKNLLIMLNSERISSRKYPKWSENLFETFIKLNVVIPELNFLFQDLGLSEDNIMQSAWALQEGLTQSQKYKLSRFISQQYTIQQRASIPKLSAKEDFTGLDLDRVKSIFNSANIYEVRADLDSFILLAQIAKENNQMMLEIAQPWKGSKGTYELATHLMDLFKQELRQKRFQQFDAEPLPADEEPETIHAVTLRLLPSYFVRNESNVKLPKIMKRCRTETDVGYEMRIKNFLLNMDDNQFMRVSELIDPEDPQQVPFFELFNEIMDERNNKPEKSSKCTIF